jgi:hypothetical protein
MGAQSYASLYSPEFRVEGNIVGALVDDADQRAGNGNANRISVAEAGVSMRSYVDPYFEFDLSISGGEGFEGESLTSEFGIDQAFAIMLRDEWGFWARIGKQPTSFGEYNDEDPDEQPFVTAPDAIIQYFGEDDGYIDTGIEVNWNAVFLEHSHIFWLGLLNGDNPVVFHNGVERKPVYFARYEFFHDFGPLTGFEFGLSYLRGLNRHLSEVGNDVFIVRGETRFWNTHMEFNFQPAVDYLYSGFKINGEYFHQTRGYFKNADLNAASSAAGVSSKREETTDGWYVTAYYKLSRNWDTSLRVDQAPQLLAEFDQASAPAASKTGEVVRPAGLGAYTIYGTDDIQAVSLTLGYHTSRFTTIRAQYTHKTLGSLDWNELWMNLQVLIGFERPDVF